MLIVNSRQRTVLSMKLQKIELTNFRNFSSFSTNLDDLAILVGENGTGKTNFLESIYFLSTSKTFRRGQERQAISWGADFFKIGGKVVAREKKKMTLYLDSQEKIYQINNKKTYSKDILGQLPTVLFTAEQIEAVSGPPSARRKLFNTVLCQKDQEYLKNLYNYQRTLFARNRLLFSLQYTKPDEKQLLFWDKALVGAGKILIQTRQKMVEFFNPLLLANWRKVATGFDLVLEYKPSCLAESLEEELSASHNHDIEMGQTTKGPHRDDFALMGGGKPLGVFGSRGEQRSALLALKLAEKQFLTGQDLSPILLLDDVFSELDLCHRKALDDFLDTSQAIFTTTDLHLLPEKLVKKAQIITLNKESRGES